MVSKITSLSVDHFILFCKVEISVIKKDAENGNTNCKDSDYYHTTKLKISILHDYLPKQMTREEVVAAVHEILDGGEFIGFGLMMKKVMSELKGKADARLIREVVESL